MKNIFYVLIIAFAIHLCRQRRNLHIIFSRKDKVLPKKRFNLIFISSMTELFMSLLL
ncbi:hypothetical protein OIU79_028889 [Salix purpurea]|uniref:Uncharacterized protein n=1 Tax=Salix purpurea TaxID=77065 RepID=A0A9Q0VXF7_SALPP|nr:hypothetical protein OIU79_028889 [Salix purpurea]